MALLAAAFGWGFRHGFDVDHLAAIGDLSTGAVRRRDAVLRATWYAAGHAAVLLLLGAAVVLAGTAIPPAVDAAAGRLVGATLVALGVWTLWAVRTDGSSFRLRGRWALVMAWRAPAPTEVEVVHDHEHDHRHGHHHHDHAELAAVESAATTTGGARPTTSHRHPHVHRGVVPAPPPGPAASVGIGMVHGIGAETPTQVALLAATAGAGGAGAGIGYLVAFVAGLFMANSAVALGFAGGVMDPARHPLAHRLLGIVVGGASVVMGGAMVAGIDLVTFSLA